MTSPVSDVADLPRQHPVRLCMRWGLSVLVAVAWVLVVQKAKPANALDLGRPMLVLPMLPVMVIAMVYWLVQGLWRCLLRRGAGWVPWTHLLILVGAVAATIAWREVANPIHPEDEPSYLRFAAAARELLRAPELGGSLRLDEPIAGAEESAQVIEARRRLEPMLPAYWPRQWLNVHLDEDTVVLYRGGGFGRVGIRVYSSAHAGLTNEADSPHAPRRISDHVWFFRD